MARLIRNLLGEDSNELVSEYDFAEKDHTHTQYATEDFVRNQNEALSEQLAQFAKMDHTHAQYAMKEFVRGEENKLEDKIKENAELNETTYAKKEDVETNQKRLDNLIAVLKQLRVPSRYENGFSKAPLLRLQEEKSGGAEGEFNWAARAVLDAIKPYTP